MFGISLFNKEVMYTKHVEPDRLTEKLETMPFAELKVDLEFKNLEEGRIGFKERSRMFNTSPRQSHYTPVMHGLLEINQYENRIKVKGIGNWSALALPFFFLYISQTLVIEFPDPFPLVKYFFAVGPFLLLGFIYYKQATMYNKLISLLKDELGIIE